MKQSLLVFGKAPRPGKVKTRLTPELTAEDAARVYRCMLLDTLEKVRGLSGRCRVVVWYEAGDEAESFFRANAGNMETAVQEGECLGERMRKAFQAAFAQGAEDVVIIGTDVPHLPSELILRAFDDLHTPGNDLIFGPSFDGGYYLLGMRQLHGELFQGIDWGTDTVLARSSKIARENGLNLQFLPLLSDVDRVEDLSRPELLDDRNEAPRTREFLRDLFQREPGIQSLLTSAPLPRIPLCQDSR